MRSQIYNNTGIIFSDKKFSEKCFTHDVETLLKAANLEAARGIAIQTNPPLGVNWQIVKDWNVDVRYQSKTEAEARRLYEAVTNSVNGVLPWINSHW